MTGVAIAELTTQNLRVSSSTLWRFLVLRSDDGHEGFGEYTVDLPENQLEPVIEHLRRRFVGTPLDENPISELAALAGRSLAFAAVCSAFEHALQALLAQRAGLSLSRRLGAGERAVTVPLYANINRCTKDRSAEGFARSAAAAVAAGFKAIKIAPFDGVTPIACQNGSAKGAIDQGLERVRAVAQSLPQACELFVDCHWRLTEAVVKQIIPHLAAHGVTWLECPLVEEHASIPRLHSIRSSANARGMRLAGCEMMTGRDGFLPFLIGGAYDVVMPDVKYAGGLSEISAIANIARQSGATVSLHNPSGPIAHAVSVHMSAALDPSSLLEFQFDETALFHEIVSPGLMTRNGHADVLADPGLGVRLSM